MHCYSALHWNKHDTITGHKYDTPNSKTTVYYWDSALTNGNGAYSSFEYKTSGGMDFTSVGKIFRWVSSLSHG